MPHDRTCRGRGSAASSLAMDWDLSAYFDRFESPGYRVFRDSLRRDAQALLHALHQAPAVSDVSHAHWVSWILDYENLLQRLSHVSSYVSCLASADAAEERYGAEEASLGELRAEFSKIEQCIEWALNIADVPDFERLCADAHLSDAEYPLRRLRENAQRRMSPMEEELAADLAVTGGQAWSRLYFQLSGILRFSFRDPSGEVRDVPMAERATLIEDPDRAVRQAAFAGANEAWKEHEETAAAALNALAGERLLLFKRRGVNHFMDEAARASRLRRESLEALLYAIESERHLAREIFSCRQKLMGVEGDGGYVDLYAPITRSETARLSWDAGLQLVIDSFTAAYPSLGAFAAQLREKRWIDHGRREHKRPGAFCTGSALTRESRIFMTYDGTMSSLMTLAHEAGHAWHNHVLRTCRPLTASFPMTLAESASTFAEMILGSGVLRHPDLTVEQKLPIIDANTAGALAFLLDIPVRFRFEEALYEQRAEGVLSPRQLKELMVEKQWEAFGTTLAAGREDPYFWCSKLHFYIDSTFFYNYPYSFGYLLSLSLFTRFEEEGAAFLPAYEKLLEDTGRMDCESVVWNNLGEDIGDPAFWIRAIRGLEPSLAQLRGLTPPGETIR